MDLAKLAADYSDEGKARELLESLRWPDGTVCPHCGAPDAYRLTAKAGSARPVRPGVWKCRVCRKQFTVRVGTILEDSHIPLSKWVLAIHLLCASKKGMSAHQLHRMLGVTYKSAWFMAHRIRYAMTRPPLSDKLAGIVEADETFIGGKRTGSGRRGPHDKIPVLTLVERGGQARSFRVANVTAKTLGPEITAHVERSARLMTDEMASYKPIGRGMAGHETVSHSTGIYARGEAHVNSAESYFATLKRGINGVYHHVSPAHLPRYLAEFDFRYNARDVSDGERAERAMRGAEGKRLTFAPLREARG